MALLPALAACVGAGSVQVPAPPASLPDAPAPTTEPRERPFVPWSAEAVVPGISSREASEVLFSDDVLPVFEIELGDAEVDALLVDPYTWVEGALVYGGLRYEPVGVRLKGENSFQPLDAKPSFKIDFDRYAALELLGLDGITLDNMSNDPSMVHERIAYRAFREAGVPASRCTHASVVLNDDSYGLYALVEDVDAEMAGAWFADATGTMFEVHDVDFEAPYTPADFTVDFGPGDTTNLQGVFDAVALLEPEAVFAALEQHMSVPGWVDYWAVAAAVGQFDSYPYAWPGDDTHLYDDPGSGVLYWLPHGVDETLQDPYRSVTFDVQGEIARACLAQAACYDAFRTRVDEVMDVLEGMDLYGYADGVIEQVEPLILIDPRRPYGLQTIRDAQSGVLDFLDGRREDLDAQLDAP